MNHPILSIICPVRNAESTLERMLDSILAQKMNTNDFELIVCDDCSIDRSSAILDHFHKAHPEINMTILQTSEDDVHCPGNARNHALLYAAGLWLYFLDADDTLSNQACDAFFEYIRSGNDTKLMIKSRVNQVDDDQQVISEEPLSSTTLHGIFYNREFISRYDVSFGLNMPIFEDAHFNSQCFSSIFYTGDPSADFGYIDQVTYNWTCSLSSLTSKLFNISHGHVEIYFVDAWIQSIFSPFARYLHIWPVPNREMFINRINQTIYGLYHIYENILYRKDLDSVEDSVITYAEHAMKECVHSICDVYKNAFRCDMRKTLHDSSNIFCEEYFCIMSNNNYFVHIHTFDQFLDLMSESL